MPNPPPTVTAIFPVPKCPSIAGRTQNKPQPKLLSAVTAVLPVSILVVLQQTQFSELRFGHFRICYRRSQPYIRSQSAPKWGHILGTQKWPLPNLLSAVTGVHPVSKCSKKERALEVYNPPLPNLLSAATAVLPNPKHPLRKE